MRCSFHILLLGLSSTALAATNPIPHKPPARLLAQLSPSSHSQDGSITIATKCRPGEVICNDGCMFPLDQCCADGEGHCDQGYSCVTDGCCPVGATCSDDISCEFGEVPCGEKNCMPKGSVCCIDGAYCHAGEECLLTLNHRYTCKRVGESGDPHAGGESKTTGGTVGATGTTSSLKSTSIPSRSASSIFTDPREAPSLSIPSITSTPTTDFTSSSATETSTTSTPTTTSEGNVAIVKTPGVALAFGLISMMMMLAL